MATCIRGVYNRMAQVFSRPKAQFESQKFRHIIAGLVVGATMNEIISYMMIRKSIELGEVKPVFMDIVFGSISFVSVLALPLLCWAGSRHRVTMIAAWLFLGVVFVFPIFFMQFDNISYSELCNAVTVSRGQLSAVAIVRLVIVVSMALFNSLAFVCMSVHALAIADVQSPGTLCLDVAEVLGVRVLLLTSGYDIMYEFVQDKLWLQMLILLPHTLFFLIMLRGFRNEMGISDVVEVGDRGDRGFFSSLTSVLSNRWAMVHSFLAALLVTGLWGYATNDYEAAKAKYYLNWTFDSLNVVPALLRGVFIIIFIKINGYDFSEPIMKFNKSQATGNTTKQTIRAIVGLIVIAIIGCNKSSIDGISTAGYSIPTCSLGCGCHSPASQYSPVCLLDTMTTYLSPCHAGCSGTVEVNNVTLYSNCRCSSRGLAIPGACNNSACDIKYSAHQLITAIVYAFVLIAVMMQIMLVVRSVRARERAIALGVTFSLTSLIAFVGGHLGYKGIAMHTCLFWDGGKCQLQSEKFAIIIYSLSAGIFALVVIMNIVISTLYKRQQIDEKSTEDLSMS